MFSLLRPLFSKLVSSSLFKSSFGKLFELLKSLFQRLTVSLSDAFRWGFNNLKDWLSPVLKALGIGAIGLEGVSIFVDSWNNVNEKFGLIAQFFQIDDLISSIGAVVNPRLSIVTDSTFEQIFSYCGGVHCINLFLNNASIAIGVSIALLLLSLFGVLVKTIVSAVSRA